MTHYTLAGFGKVICGRRKNKNDNYLHYGLMYGKPEPSDLCLECKHITHPLSQP